MFEQLVARESALDAVLPRPRLRGRVPGELLTLAREWSEAVWIEAERLGPFSINQAQTSHGIEVAMRPVFVCGVHRSGTTLVRDLIDGHPALSVLPSEGSFSAGGVHARPGHLVARGFGKTPVRFSVAAGGSGAGVCRACAGRRDRQSSAPVGGEDADQRTLPCRHLA